MTFIPVPPIAAPVIDKLDALVDQLGPLANAVNDNAWDHSQPLDKRLADIWIRQLRDAINAIDNATGAPAEASAYSLPSMSGKELV